MRASFEAVGLRRLTVEGGTRMGLHRNARLGLAGRRALVADIESGCSCREAARRRGRFAFDGLEAVGALVCGDAGPAAGACLSRGQFVKVAGAARAAGARL